MTSAIVHAALTEAIQVLEWSPAGGGLAAGDLDGHLLLLDGPGAVPEAKPRAHRGGITAARWHPLLPRLATGGADGSAVLWEGSRELTTIEVDGVVHDIAWSPLGDLLAVAAGWSVYVVDPDGRHVAAFEALPGAASALSWAAGPGPLAVGTHGGIAWLAPGRHGGTVEHWDSTGATRRLARSPTGALLASTDLSCVLRITDLATQHEVAIAGWDERIEGLAWNGPGSALAVPGGDEITVWHLSSIDAADGDPVLLRGHHDLVTDLAYGGTGGTSLAAGGADGQLIVWPGGDLRSQHRIHVGEEIRRVAWAPDGHTVAVGTAEGTIRVLPAHS